MSDRNDPRKPICDTLRGIMRLKQSCSKCRKSSCLRGCERGYAIQKASGKAILGRQDRRQPKPIGGIGPRGVAMRSYARPEQYCCVSPWSIAVPIQGSVCATVQLPSSLPSTTPITSGSAILLSFSFCFLTAITQYLARAS